MQLIEGCFIRSGLVPAFKEINEKVGFVRPKKFAKFALLSDDRREKAIQAFIEGGKEKKEKMKTDKDVLNSMNVPLFVSYSVIIVNVLG
jgi:leucine-rich PPR motif-containing protein